MNNNIIITDWLLSQTYSEIKERLEKLKLSKNQLCRLQDDLNSILIDENISEERKLKVDDLIRYVNFRIYGLNHSESNNYKETFRYKEVLRYVENDPNYAAELIVRWETFMSEVMPNSMKDWWQNSQEEWPSIAKTIYENLKETKNYDDFLTFKNLNAIYKSISNAVDDVKSSKKSPDISRDSPVSTNSMYSYISHLEKSLSELKTFIEEIKIKK